MRGVLSNHNLVFGGDKESAVLWNIDENIENSTWIETLPHMPWTDSSINSLMTTKTTISAIDWKPDGTMFITAATDGICRLWNSKGEISVIMYNDNAMPLKVKDTSYFTYPNGTNDSSQTHIVTPDDIDSISDWKWNKDGTAIVTVSEK